MKCFGYSKNDDEELLELTVVTFQADPRMLRKLADFLIHCANNLESEAGWEHEHLCDYLADEEFSVDVVVYRNE